MFVIKPLKHEVHLKQFNSFTSYQTEDTKHTH